MSQDDICFDVAGHAGIVTLYRPKALNALNYAMVDALSRQLLAWRDDENIAMVIVRGSGGRAFCAGGDIGEVVRLAEAQGVDAAHNFFRDEYRMNWRIKHYPKPYISFIDGIIMGGGFGISVHGTHRIMGANTIMAMPETAIGLFPDVGGTFILPRLAGNLGLFMALTGTRLNGEQAVKAGIGTHYSGDICQQSLVEELLRVAPGPCVDVRVAAILNEAGMPMSKAPVLPESNCIGRLFKGWDYPEVVAGLQADGGEFALKQLEVLSKMSPLSLAVTTRQMAFGARHGFDDCMRLEYQMVRHFLIDSDFREGVRAMVIDKDREPKWRPADRNPEGVEAYFQAVVAPLTFDWCPK